MCPLGRATGGSGAVRKPGPAFCYIFAFIAFMLSLLYFWYFTSRALVSLALPHALCACVCRGGAASNTARVTSAPWWPTSTARCCRHDLGGKEGGRGGRGGGGEEGRSRFRGEWRRGCTLAVVVGQALPLTLVAGAQVGGVRVRACVRACVRAGRMVRQPARPPAAGVRGQPAGLPGGAGGPCRASQFVLEFPDDFPDVLLFRPFKCPTTK
jgi:hypothetical protein